MRIKEILKWIFHRERCFLCNKRFKKGDRIVNWFGGWAHFTCFDKQMKENERKGRV